ncbi:MAG: DUF4347 domain-containing protein [Lentisphaeria bacterium]|nr:DUF4347 domain-containing protein [Lentisphaeria bacterium]
MNNFDIFRLEDRVLFEGAAAGDAAAAESNEPAGADQAAGEAQEWKDAVPELPPENPAQATLQQAAEQNTPSDVADIDAELQALIDGKIGSGEYGEAVAEQPGAESAGIGFSGLFPDDGGETLVFDPEAAEEPITVDADSPAADEPAISAGGKELVIINSSVPDAEKIISSLSSNQECLILEEGRDAFEQINDYLDAQDGRYSAIHIVSHGNSGYFVLNGQVIDSGRFDAEAWSAIGEHITGDGDILLYGCNLADDDAGRDLVGMIADASGADVAASSDLTGVSGNWELEFNYGAIETVSITVDGYGHNLTDYLVSNDLDSGTNSLRWALEQANGNTGTDSITFDSSFFDGSKVITLTGGEIAITDDVVIDGLGADRIIVDGNGGRIFNISASNVTISGMTLRNAASAGNGGAVYFSGSGELQVSNSDFLNNSAAYGGAIFMNSGKLVLTGSGNFTGNTAVESGGAIYANGAADITGSGAGILFSGNTAKGTATSNGGGAVYGKGVMAISGDVAFTGNKAHAGQLVTIATDSHGAALGTWGGSGGAIYATGTLTVQDGVSFSDNLAGGTSGYAAYGGGAIYATNGVTVKGSVSFSGNRAASDDVTRVGTSDYKGTKVAIESWGGDGGAIYLAGGKLVLESGAGGSIVFDGNIARGKTGGGAVYSRGTVSITGNVSFVNNTASFLEKAANGYHSGTYAKQNTYSWGGNGGAINSTGAVTIAGTDVVFRNNLAGGSGYGNGGGAIYLAGGGTFSGNITFAGNQAVCGSLTTVQSQTGGLLAVNTWGGDGGAVYVAGGSLNINAGADDTITFSENVAKGQNGGGAIYIGQGRSTTISGTGVVLFKGNYATDDPRGYSVGGAFYGEQGSHLTVNNTNTSFVENWAANYAGAIHSYCAVTLNGTAEQNIVFRGNYVAGNNSPRTGGGAIEISQGTLNAKYCLFEGNSVYKTSASTSYEAYGGAIHIWSTYTGAYSVSISNCTFLNNAAQFGGAIYAGERIQGESFVGKGEPVITDCTFTGNRAVALMRDTTTGAITENYSVAANGGAIAAGSGSTVAASKAGIITLVGNNIFRNNSAVSTKSGFGGAIYIGKQGNSYLGSLVFRDGATTLFKGNSATSGGAIYIGTGGLVTFNSAVQTFSGNTVTADGGAIYFEAAAASDTEKVLSDMVFEDNLADGNGGAIYSNRAFTLTGGTFSGNEAGKDGGAICMGNYLLTISDASGSAANPMFSENSAGGNGGAIYFSGNAAPAGSGQIVFSGNRASKGGAVYFSGTGDLTAGGSFLFMENKALTGLGQGGAIYAAGALTLGANNVFDSGAGTGNSAKQGGAVYASSTLTASGGTVNFRHQSAKQGGAVYFASAAAPAGSFGFASNSAEQGGAVYFSGTGDLSQGSFSFTGNSALTGSGQGGAIYAAGALTLGANNVFDSGAGTGNSAKQGGAIYVNTSLRSTGANTFRHQKAEQGGVLYFASAADLSAEAFTFLNNEAQTGLGQGGAIYAAGVLTLGANNVFDSGAGTGNSAKLGGAVYASSTLTASGGTVNFRHQSAKQGGAVYFASAAAPAGSFGFASNSAEQGGAVYFSGTGDLSQGSFSFTGNSALTGSGQGGAIYAAGALTLGANNVFDNGAGTGNSANQGGAIYANDSVVFLASAAFRHQSAEQGGAIYFVNDVTLKPAAGTLVFESNTASDKGGAVYGAKSIALENLAFTGNSSGGDGGALYAEGKISGSGTAFQRNSAAGRGGAVFGLAGVEFIDSTFGVENDAAQKNSAAQGGGVYGVESVTFDRVGFYGNTATAGGGAVVSTGDVSISHSLFYDNGTTGGAGGALLQSGDGASDVMITHSEFRRNEAAGNGGAISLAGNSAALLSNTLIADSVSRADGGGIWSAGALKLLNVTLVSNSAVNHGGVYAGGTGNRMENTIVWGNRVTGANAQFAAGSFDRGVEFSAIQGWASGGTGNISLEDAAAGTDAYGKYHANFTDAANEVYTLNANSYLINRGSNAFNSSATDLAGSDRVQKGYIDMGAYESGSKGNIILAEDVQHIIYGDTEDLVTQFGGIGGGGYSIVSKDTAYVIVSGDRLTAVKANGEVEVCVIVDGDDNWNGATAKTTVFTHKRDLVVTGSNDVYQYDGKHHSGSYTIDPSTSLAFNDSVDGVKLANERNAGEYDHELGGIRIVGGSGDDMSENYDLVTVDGTLVIEAATLVVIRDADDKVYDGSAGTTYRHTVNGVLEGDKVFYNAGSAVFGDADVGTDKSFTVDGDSLAGEDLGNYIVVWQDINGDITPLAITVEADSHVKYVGDPDPEYTWKITDGYLVAGDRLEGGLSCDKQEVVGIYDIERGTLDNRNYTITYVKGTLEILDRENPQPDHDYHHPMHTGERPYEPFRVMTRFEINRKLIDPNPTFAEVAHGLHGHFHPRGEADRDHLYDIPFEQSYRFSLEKAANFKDSLDLALEQLVVI